MPKQSYRTSYAVIEIKLLKDFDLRNSMTSVLSNTNFDFLKQCYLTVPNFDIFFSAVR